MANDTDREELKSLALAKLDESAADDSGRQVYGAALPFVGDVDLKGMMVDLFVEKALGSGADYLEANKDAIAGTIADYVNDSLKFFIDKMVVFADSVRK